MSTTDTGNVVDIKAIRNRLWNPANGRTSSELEITLNTRAQQQQAALRAEEKKAREDFERRLKLQTLFEEAMRERRTARRRRTQEIAEALEALESLSPTPPSIKKIIEVTSQYYGVSHHEVMSRRNNQKISYARQVAMYLSMTLTKKSYPAIARGFDNRDHTTVLFGVRKIKELVDTRPHIAAEIEEIKKLLEVSP